MNSINTHFVPNRCEQLDATTTQTLIDSFQIYTSKQLIASSKSLDVIESVQRTFAAIARSADFTNKTYQAKISYSRIVERCSINESTAVAHVAALLKLGVITRSYTGYICKKTGQRRQSANIYTFQLPTIKKICNDLRVKFLKSKAHIQEVVKSNKPLQIDNIKRTAIVGFSSIKAMFSKKIKGQYVDSVTGLLFATYNERNDYRNAIGYVPTRPRSRLIFEAITYHASNNLDVVLDNAWLKQIESELKAKESSKPQIDYQFFTYATNTHTHNVGCFYFKDEVSRLAIIERDREWYS